MAPSRSDEKGRISPRGDAPDPRRIHGEAWTTDFTVEPERDICTDALPTPLAEYFQRVDKTQAERWAADYLEVQKYRAKLKADAIAQARDTGDEIEKRWFEAIGFTPPEEPRGRPKSERKDSAVQLSLLRMPDTSVQISLHGSNAHSVHNGFSNFEQPESFSEEISPSLFVSSEVLQSDYRVSGGAADREIAETPPPPPAPALSQSPPKNPPEKEEADPLIEAVESKFERKLAARDPLRAKFAELPAQFGIPARSVVRFFQEKFKKKQAAGYSIDTPGALYKMTVEDLAGWIPQRWKEIQSDLSWERTWERREPISAAPEDEEPFDPLEFNRQMQALIARKGT